MQELTKWDWNEDPDKLFSYNTKQQVNIQDRYLGLTNVFLQIVVICYIAFGVIYLDEGYLEFEDAQGGTATLVNGDILATTAGRFGARYFSSEDLTQPGLENGNVFISTRQTIYTQRRGVCEDQSMPCEIDDDCTEMSQGKCSQKGFCLEHSWCNDGMPEQYDLPVGTVDIWTKSSIQFIRLAPSAIFSTESEHSYPEPGVNVFSIRELLLMCKPVPIHYEEISELGAAIEVQFIWNCDVGEKTCKPQIEVRRVDTLFDEVNIGYSFRYPEYVTEDERRLYEMRGLRIFIRTVGQGRKMSIAALIMKASTTSALLSIAPIVADLLMLKMFKLSKKYYSRKYEISPGFKDFIKRREDKKKDECHPGLLEDHDTKLHATEQAWQRRLQEDDP